MSEYPKTIKSVEVPGNGIQAHGAYVIRDFGPDQHDRYVVHFRNDQDGGYHSGNYCRTLEEAEERLARRSDWVAAYALAQARRSAA